MSLKYVDEVNFKGKKVIARFDFNVPLAKDGSGKITDTTRIDMAMPTIKYILEHGASKLIMMSHLGRPKDGVKDAKYSLEPVAKYLATKLGQEVVLTESCTDKGIKNLIGLNATKLVLLENVRFHIEETKNDHEFAKTLAGYADFYVNDAFGTAHREHASTYEINAFFKNNNAAGFLMRQEIEALNKVVESPKHPFIAIVGGAKVADKIKIIEKLLVNVDKMIIGGAMAYPFLKAQGHNIGKSLCDAEDVDLARKILGSASAKKISLPIDHIVSDSTEGKGETINSKDIPSEKMGLDVGPKTMEYFRDTLKDAQTVLWNGPMGFFENKEFAKGTMEIAKILSNLKGAFTLVGGGDSVSAVQKAGLSD
ncbi:MAG: phosphoglycerate kinase, partial [Bdellovibrionales bacterium RIFOXYC2_FULL_39_8]